MLHVTIVTPEKLVYEDDASEIEAPGWKGEFGVLDGHDAFLSLMRGGVVTIHGSSGVQRFVVGRGFVEAGPSSVTILADSCKLPDQVDKAAARQELQRAESDLLEVVAGTPACDHVEERRELAVAAIDV
jgi:F-type H+-transporting ATPase subunit epsilon